MKHFEKTQFGAPRRSTQYAGMSRNPSFWLRLKLEKHALFCKKQRMHRFGAEALLSMPFSCKSPNTAKQPACTLLVVSTGLFKNERGFLESNTPFLRENRMACFCDPARLAPEFAGRSAPRKCVQKNALRKGVSRRPATPKWGGSRRCGAQSMRPFFG